MCAPHPIQPLGAEEYVPPNPRNAAREMRRARARLNELARCIADFCEDPPNGTNRIPPASIIAEYARAKHDARRAELRLRAVRRATSNKKEAV